MFWNKGNSDFLTKKDEIEIIIEKHRPLIFGILEANINQDAHSPALQIEGYRLEREQAPDCKTRTRTAVFIKEEIKYKRRSDLEQPNTSMIWLEVFTSTKPWLLFLGYRQFSTLDPKTAESSLKMIKQIERLQKWQTAWAQAEKEEKPMLLMGDMNIDVSTWVNPQLQPTSYQSSKKSLLKLLKDMALMCNL